MSLKFSKQEEKEYYEELVKDFDVEIIGFIPARGGSKEIKDKNLVMLAGYPLVAHAILSLKVAGVNRIYVSTDSKRIADVANLYGAEIINRPPHLAEDFSQTEEAITHFYSKVNADAVAMRQCTSPLLEPEYIRQAINKFIVDGYDSLFTAVNTRKNDILLWNAGLRAVNYYPKSRKTRQTRRGKELFIETGGLYLFRKKAYIKEHCRICGKHGIQEVPLHQSFEIDSEKDLNIIRKVLKK